MRRIQNITSEPIQRHIILIEDAELTLTIRFYPKTQIWCFDAELEDWAVYGVKLTVGVLHIESQNKPFDFIVTDASGVGLDPFQRSDFETGRCVLYMLSEAEMLERRGVEVPL